MFWCGLCYQKSLCPGYTCFYSLYSPLLCMGPVRVQLRGRIPLSAFDERVSNLVGTAHFHFLQFFFLDVWIERKILRHGDVEHWPDLCGLDHSKKRVDSKNLSRGGAVYGPAAYFLWIHVAMLSVTALPLLIVLTELVTWHGPRFSAWWDGTLFLRYSVALLALLSWALVKRSPTAATFFSKACTSIWVPAPSSGSVLRNLLQKN